jgi:beta-N-acetylhexosaminidase
VGRAQPRLLARLAEIALWLLPLVFWVGSVPPTTLPGAAQPGAPHGAISSGGSFAPHALSPGEQAALMVGSMSLDDKLGQMMIFQFTDSVYTPQQAALVRPFHPGGVILYDYAMGSAQQVRDLLAAGQADSPIPMFTFIDLEGGGVDRLQKYLGARMSAPAMAATGDPAVARREGAKVAKDMLSFGLNADLAPDVDVKLVDGPDQFDRTFGTTPAPVSQFAGAWLDGLQSGGVVGTLKHFPGLGDATTDAHEDLPVISRSRAAIEATELAPYRQLIASGQAQMIMSTDVLMPALDPHYAAEISKPIITGILRDELHFDGVAITDALYMKGIADHYLFAQAAVLAIEAGNDMIMAPYIPEQMIETVNGLKRAIASGELPMAQVDASVRRILALKIRYHLIPALEDGRKRIPGALPPTARLGAPTAADALIPTRDTL